MSETPLGLTPRVDWAFQDLSNSELEDLGAQLSQLSVARGETLVHQGAPDSALYLVVSGRFQIYKQGSSQTIAPIGVGDPIGEIAFFSGGPQTASVRAKRDSPVLKLERTDFERLETRSPAIWRMISDYPGRRPQSSSSAICRDQVRLPLPHFRRKYPV